MSERSVEQVGDIGGEKGVGGCGIVFYFCSMGVSERT